MEDRFKYRVWDKEEKKMYYNAERTYDDGCEGGYNASNIPRTNFGYVLDDDNFIVMQCTGLKDNNGNLIYERDIVNDGLSIFEVYFDNDYLKLKVKGKDLDDNHKFCEDIHEFLPTLSKWETIGNIHEEVNDD